MFDQLPQVLRLLRESRGLSLAQVARRSGLGQHQVKAYEDATHRPRLETLERLLEALEVSDFEFLVASQAAPPEAPPDRHEITAALPDHLPAETAAHLAEALRHLGRFLQLAGLQILPFAVPRDAACSSQTPGDDFSVATSRSA